MWNKFTFVRKNNRERYKVKCLLRKKVKKKGSRRALKGICIVLAVIIVLVGGFTIVSHAVYHRSDMATLVELFFRVSGTKAKFQDAKKCAAYIEERRNAEEYVMKNFKDDLP